MYEVYVRPTEGGHIVYRIVKFIGDSQMEREIEFDSLSKDLVSRIEEEFHKQYAKETEPSQPI
jgi:hypothetical protein